MKVCVLCVFAVQCVRQVPQRRRGALLLLQGPLRLPNGPLTPTPGPPPWDPHPGTPTPGPPTWDPHPGGLMNRAGDPSHRADPTAFRRRMRRTRSRVFITGASPYRRHSGPVSQNSLDAFTQSAPGRPRSFSSCVVVFYSWCPGELGHGDVMLPCPEPRHQTFSWRHLALSLSLTLPHSLSLSLPSLSLPHSPLPLPPSLSTPSPLTLPRVSQRGSAGEHRITRSHSLPFSL